MIDKDEIISLFRLHKTGNKGWMASESGCPFCGKIGKLAIILEDKSSFICQKCKAKGSIWKLLAKIERLDLVSDQFAFLPKNRVEDKINIADEEENLDYTLPIITPPIGFKRITDHPYLNGRGFVKEQYDQFGIGITKIDPKLGKDYIIFQIKDQKGNLVGYVGRSLKSKEQIKIINNRRKEKANSKKYYKYLRWVNSGDGFGKMLSGCDEILPGVTKTIVVVEGFTDKANIDNLLKLREQDKIKCNGTFSNKVSSFQIKIWQDLGIENIILLYDSDEDLLDTNKQQAFELSRYFKVGVGYQEEGKDPGEYLLEDALEVLDTLESPLDFSKNKVQIDI